jgi:hypothetical protein
LALRLLGVLATTLMWPLTWAFAVCAGWRFLGFSGGFALMEVA